jgi:hypothetical protein
MLLHCLHATCDTEASPEQAAFQKQPNWKKKQKKQDLLLF